MLELRCMKYSTVKEVLSGDVSKGDFVALNEVNGFYFADGVSGDAATVVTRADKVEGPMAAVTIAPGEAAYIITASGLLTNVDGGGANPLVGHFLEDRANTESTALIDFDGTLAFAKA